MTVYPGAAWLPVPNHGGAMSQHLGLVLHVQQGNNGLQGWFSNPDSGASSTWWVSKTGRCEQYVDAELQAWAQGSGNATYNSVETEGWVEEPLTDAQIDGLASLYRWGHDHYGWPFSTSDVVGQPGFGWHGMGGAAWGGHPSCPGDLRKAQRTQVLQIAGGMVIPPTNGGDDLPLSDADKQWITQTVHSQVLSIVRSDEFKGRVRDGSALVVPTDEFKDTVRDQANAVATTWVRSDEFKGRVRDGCELALDDRAGS